MKKCSKCKKEKEITNFYKNSNYAVEYNSRCKDCCRASNKKYRSKNRNKINGYQKLWREENSKHCKEWSKRNYEDNIEKRREAITNWRNKIVEDAIEARVDKFFTKPVSSQVLLK
jgi:type II secretory ATPase GspE/PulE/Tfp pilus assembly ATPase PilB-like protein